MKTNIILLVLICIYNPCIGMKRPCVSRQKQSKTKQPKFDPSTPLYMHDFFAIHEQLEQIYKNNKNAIEIMTTLPSDIKILIASYAVKPAHNWWYCDKKREYENNRVSSLCFSPDGKLAIGFMNNIEIIDPNTDEAISRINTPLPALSLAYNSDGTKLAYGFDAGIKIFETNNYSFEKQIKTKNIVWALAFQPETGNIAIGMDNKNPKNVQIINPRNKKRLMYHTFKNDIYGIFFLEQNKLVCGSSKNALYTINIENQNKATRNYHEELILWSTSFQGKFLALGYKTGAVKIFNIDSHQEILSFSTHDLVYSVALNKQANQLAIGLVDGTFLLLKKYIPTTAGQILLRKIIFLWLQAEKPDKKVVNPEQLLRSVANKFNLNAHELKTSWNTLPSIISLCLWEKIEKLIQQYGK